MSRLPPKKDDRGSPISKQPQRYPSDSFDEEDLDYYLDKEGLIKSSRIYYGVGVKSLIDLSLSRRGQSKT
jgi:hypothetical protein